MFALSLAFPLERSEQAAMSDTGLVASVPEIYDEDMVGSAHSISHLRDRRNEVHSTC